MRLRNGNCQVLVLASGGIDSTACLRFFLDQGCSIDALFLDYGQPAADREGQAATAICTQFGVNLSKLILAGLPEVNDGFVMGRNAIFVHAALMYMGRERGMIGIGIHAGTRYPDCTEEFAQIMQASLDLYTNGRVLISAPFLHWSKQMIWDYCRNTGVPLHLTYSCELGHEQPCGECLSCRDLEALHASKD